MNRPETGLYRLVLVALWFMFALSINLSANSKAQASSVINKSMQLNQIEITGLQRSYYQFFPSNYKSSIKPQPLIIVLHGGGRKGGFDLEKNSSLLSWLNLKVL